MSVGIMIRSRLLRRYSELSHQVTIEVHVPRQDDFSLLSKNGQLIEAHHEEV